MSDNLGNNDSGLQKANNINQCSNLFNQNSFINEKKSAILHFISNSISTTFL